MQKQGTLKEGRYILLKKVGEGGYSRVYRALDCESGEVVAVKATDLTGDSAKEAIQEEAMILRILKHPGLSGFRDYFEVGGRNQRSGSERSSVGQRQVQLDLTDTATTWILLARRSSKAPN